MRTDSCTQNTRQLHEHISVCDSDAARRCTTTTPRNASLTLPRALFLPHSPDGQKKAYVRLTQDYDALDVANRIGII